MKLGQSLGCRNYAAAADSLCVFYGEQKAVLICAPDEVGPTTAPLDELTVVAPKIVCG